MIWSNSFGQTYLEAKLTNEICKCLSNEKMTEINSELFNKCNSEVLDKNYNLILSAIKVYYEDTSYESSKKMGASLQKRVSVLLIDKCDKYYTYKLRERNLKLLEIKNVDRGKVQITIDSLNEIQPEFKNALYFRQKGNAFFILGNYDEAIIDFHQGSQMDSLEIRNFYMEAWSYELMGNYTKAIKLYENLSSKTGISLFQIYAAMVRRKQNRE